MLEQIQALQDAAAILYRARIALADQTHTLWSKVNRIGNYIDAQVAELLTQLINEGE